ncbi:MAG: hypothetical protein F6K45_06705 [Kamptonema sp. SIO1D9]|nr:hypothetical protein [Kamptonema sp. SIO1D9]
MEVQQRLDTVTAELQQEREAKVVAEEQLQVAEEQFQQERQRSQRLEQLLREVGIDPREPLPQPLSYQERGE